MTATLEDRRIERQQAEDAALVNFTYIDSLTTLRAGKPRTSRRVKGDGVITVKPPEGHGEVWGGRG